MGRLVLLETSDIGARYTAEAARALGHEPLFVCDLTAYRGDPLRQLLAYTHIHCPSTSSPAAVLEAIRRLPGAPIVGVTSLADARLKASIEVARELGVAGLDPRVSWLKNKCRVAEWTPEWSPPFVAFDPAADPESWLSRLTAIFERYGRLIIKPVDGAGARGVFTVRSPAELLRMGELARAQRVPCEVVGSQWMAQAFVPGRLYSVEGYAMDAQVHVLGWTDRAKVGSTESRAGFPADNEIPDSLRERGTEAVRALIARSGFTHGYFHIEFLIKTGGKTDGDEIHLIDANMGRLGGGPIGELLALSYDVDPIAIYRHVLEISLWGHASSSPYDPAMVLGHRQPSYSVLYGLQDGGEVTGLRFPPDARVFHTQLLASGERVTPMGADDWSWVGIVTGLRTDTARAVEGIRIQTATGEFPACY